MAPHFKIPLNLPHAGTLAGRIEFHLQGAPIPEITQLVLLLAPYTLQGENPPGEEASRVIAEAAELGRTVVDGIEKRRIGHDRLGQAVRNLFECLGLGEEGAAISLRAGENPKSILRPDG